VCVVVMSQRACKGVERRVCSCGERGVGRAWSTLYLCEAGVVRCTHRADPVPEHERLFRIFEDDAVPMNVDNTVNKVNAQQELAHLTGQLRYLRSLARTTTPTTAPTDGTHKWA
jgi:hypothetical protein